MKKILITGANGMLGRTLQKVLSYNYIIIPTDIHNLNITNINQVNQILDFYKPDIVIHCAALTNVDYCESHEQEALKINSFGTANIAYICNKLNIKLVYISTDYVFDGKSNISYNEFNNPSGGINIYGKSKYYGQQYVQKYCSNYIIARVSWLYGHGGPSFLHTIYNLSKSKSEISVVNDQIGNPTSTLAVSNALLNILNNDLLAGIFHLTCSGEATWYEFAKEFYNIMSINTKVIACSSQTFKTAAQRPANSRLEKYALKFNNLPNMPFWKDSLIEFCNTEIF